MMSSVLDDNPLLITIDTSQVITPHARACISRVYEISVGVHFCMYV